MEGQERRCAHVRVDVVAGHHLDRQREVGAGDRGTSHGPALAAAWYFGGSIDLTVLMAWRGIGPDSHLWFATLQDRGWSGQQPLGDAFVSSHGPALASFGDSLMVAFKGDAGNNQLHSSIYDGRSWSAPEIFSWGGSSHGPAITGSGRGGVYAAWKGVGSDPRLFWAHRRDGAWSEQREVAGGAFGTSEQPAIAWLHDHAVMAWKGKGNDQRLFWSELRAGQWTEQRAVADGTVGSSAGPALAQIEGRLVMAWKGTGSDPRMFLSVYDGGSWSPQAEFLGGAAGTSHAPALTAYRTRTSDDGSRAPLRAARRRASRAPLSWLAGAGLQARDELVEAQLLEALADRVELGGAQLDQRRPSWHSSSVSRRPASPESRRRMIASRRARRVLVGAAASVIGLARAGGSAPTAPSSKRSADAPAARAAAAEVTRLAGGVLDERVAALQRALRVVRGERQREPLQPLARRARRRRRAPCDRARARAVRCRARSPASRRPARRAQLAQVLVQPRPLAGDVLGRRARQPRERLRAGSSARGRGRRAASRGDDRRPRDGAAAVHAAGAARAQPRPRLGAVHGHGGLGGVGRGRAAQRRDVVDQRAVGVVADGRDDRHAAAARPCGTASRRRSEQVGERAAAARDDDDVDLAGRREVLHGARDRAARRGGPGRARTPTRAVPPSRAGAGRPARRRAPCRPRR